MALLFFLVFLKHFVLIVFEFRFWKVLSFDFRTWELYWLELFVDKFSKFETVLFSLFFSVEYLNPFLYFSIRLNVLLHYQSPPRKIMQFRAFKLIVMEDQFFFNFIFALQKTVGILLKIWNWRWGIWAPITDKLWPFFLFWSFDMQNTEVKLCIDIILLDDLQKVIMFDLRHVRVRDCIHIVSDSLARRQELHSQQDW